MILKKFTDDYLSTLMSWFTDNEVDFHAWSGPGFRYPYTVESFKQDLKYDELASYVLISPDQQLLAFGQYYLRLEKCHLGRLVVNPNKRGQALGGELLHKLCQIGIEQLQVTSCSLFVFTDNQSAIKAYQKFGFVVAQYPEQMPIDNCYYMVLNDLQPLTI